MTMGRISYLVDMPLLIGVKERVAVHDHALSAPFQRLKQDADRLINEAIQTVVAKQSMAPSRDPHDYVSLAKYWWPNPATKDGLPYVRRDGEVNPEVDRYDVRALTVASKAWRDLSFAFFFTGDRRYAAQAYAWLTTWFVDPTTRMNPHFAYAQFVPGVVRDKGHGILEGNRLRWVPDVFVLLEAAGAISPSEAARIRSWFTELVHWLHTSPLGKAASQEPNNHAVWHAAQVSLYASFVGDSEIVRDSISRRGRELIAAQIAPNGSQPREASRTRALHYHMFNLQGLFDIATLARHIGDDLFSYHTEDGRGIRAALDYCIPYLQNPQSWPHAQITPIHWPLAVELLRRAAYAYQEQCYEDILGTLPRTGIDDPVFTVDWFDLVFPPYGKP